MEALLRILYQGEASTEVLNELLARYDVGQSRDRALMHTITLGVLRNLTFLKTVLQMVADRPIRRINKQVELVLYTGMFQVFFLDKVPMHAAVDETVKVVKNFRRKAVPFVNAVMRTVTRRHEELLGRIDSMEVLYSLPGPLLPILTTVAGRHLSEEDLKILNTPAPVTIRVNQALIEPRRLQEKLASYGVRLQPLPYARAALQLQENGLSLTDTGVIPRLAVPQDLASQMVVEVLDPQPNERVLDLCAGRGIKTTQIQEYTDSKADVTAVDVSGEKLKDLQTVTRQKGLENISVIQADATLFKSSHPFDKVLLDAPCTGSGTLRRRPEVRYRIASTDMAHMTTLQSRLLKNALRLVRPGGMVVYAVCSFLPEEGPGVWNHVIGHAPEFQTLDLSQQFPDAAFVTTQGWLLTLPFRDRMDGFFIAAARRTAQEDGTATSVPK